MSLTTYNSDCTIPRLIGYAYDGTAYSPSYSNLDGILCKGIPEDIATKLAITIHNNNGEEIKEEKKMINTNMFNGIFGRIAPGMCRVSMSGKIAIKTDSGYKAFDPKTERLTNCDNFALDVGEDFFFVIPTNKVERGDIILVGGKPKCVLSAEKNRINVFNYEDSSVTSIVPERHMFMGKQYFYGKIISMFGEMGSNKGIKNIMKLMMMKEMLGGDKNNNGVANMMPMMVMMGGLGGTGGFFDGMFDFDDKDEDNEDDIPEA